MFESLEKKKSMRIRNLFQVIRVVWLRAAAQQSIRYLGGERFRTESWRRHFPRNKINWIVGTGLIVMATSEEDLQVIKETDAMYYGGKSPEAIQILRRHSQTNNPEVLWRLVRACYTVGKFFIKDQAESKRLSDEAMEYAKRGIAIDEHSFSTQKWMGIALSWSSDFEGTKVKIERSFAIRDHFLKAIECNPTDALGQHLMGLWCFGVAEVPWYQRKIAAVIFAAPPSATYDEALAYFLKAEEAKPGFYVANWTCIGKTYIQLGKKAEAREWLTKAKDFTTTDPEDLEAVNEAAALLRKL